MDNCSEDHTDQSSACSSNQHALSFDQFDEAKITSHHGMKRAKMAYPNPAEDVIHSTANEPSFRLPQLKAKEGLRKGKWTVSLS